MKLKSFQQFNEGRIVPDVKLNSKIKKDILQDFKKWSGGFAPQECSWKDKKDETAVHKYLTTSINSKYVADAELKKEIEEWLKSLTK